jgi:hypothetical protein
VSVGLLLLSRSLAPVYVAAFAVAVGVDLLRRRRFGFMQAGVAILIVAALAGPWWLVSGGTALHYLNTAGYQPSSGFTHSGAHLSLGSIVDRTRWTLRDLGTVQTILLFAAPLIALTRIRRMSGSFVVSVWMLLTLLGLATSSNAGTAFGLPVIAVGITLGGSLLFVRPNSAAGRGKSDVDKDGSRSRPDAESRKSQAVVAAALIVIAALALALVAVGAPKDGGGDVSWALVGSAALLAGTFMRFRPTAVLAIVAVLGVGFAAEWSGHTSPSWLGPPYRRIALQATNGTPVPNIDALHREVALAIAGHTTLLIRDDDLLNGNGLRYAALVGHLPQSLISAPYGDANAGLREMRNAQYLIAGVSPASYHSYGNLADAAAAHAGWQKIGTWTPACGNTIDLWRKATGRSGRSGRNRGRPPYESKVLADRPVAYWRLDDKICNAEDATGNDNVGAYLGKPTYGSRSLVSGRGTSVQFDGKDDQVALPHLAALDVSKAISFEAWVNPYDVPTAKGAGWQLVSVWRTALLYIRGGAKPRFVFAVYNPANLSYTPLVASKTIVAAHGTYDVVGTYDGSTLRIFVNGRPQASVTYTGALSHGLFGGAIAATGWWTLPSPHFRGRLDEIAIYGHALKLSTIRAHYRAGITRSTRPKR